MSTPRPIVVIGAGVIGLTTAITLLERGHGPVHVLASHLPSDPLDARYASSIAGAHHLSFADDNDERQSRWDWRTFEVLYDEWKRDGEASGLMCLTQTELWVGSRSHLKIYEKHPDFEVIDPTSLPYPCDHAVRFTSLTVTPSIYLARLWERLIALGGKVHRVHVPSISALSTPPFRAYLGCTPRAVFVCVGLGARDLGGVEDTSVYPTRGQVVAVRAPWIRSGTTRQVGSLDGGEGGSRTYVIPRVTGQVILGGTREVDDWEPYPRKRTAQDILQRVLEVCPEIVSPNRRGDGVPAVEDIITDHFVGFRPSRTNGVRLEREDVVLGTEKVVLAHNYGHGGAGWQSSWGTAESVVALLDEVAIDGWRSKL